MKPSPGPPNRRQSQGEQSRRAILASASALFSQHGYAATPVSRLSDDCGLPPSSIYWHFGSKEGVLAAVTEHSVEQLLTGLPRADQFEGSAIERFEQMVDVIATRLERRETPTRLIVRLALEEAEARTVESHAAVVVALGQARELVLDRWREALTAVFRPTDAAGSELVDSLARLGRAVAIGCYITESAPRGDVRPTLETFVSTVAALAAVR